MMKKAQCYLIAGFLAVMLSGCRSASIMNLEEIQVPSKLDGSPHSKESVQEAILAGCQSRRWSAKVIGEDLIEAEIMVRESKAKVHIPYTDSHYSILYEDSQGLGYSETRRTINKSYQRWISFLDKSIRKALRTSK